MTVTVRADMHTLGLRKGTRRKKIWYLNGTSNFRTLCSFQKAEVRNTLSSVCMCACACACACACVCVCACAYVREFCWCWSVLPSWLFFKLLFFVVIPLSKLCSVCSGPTFLCTIRVGSSACLHLLPLTTPHTILCNVVQHLLLYVCVPCHTHWPGQPWDTGFINDAQVVQVDNVDGVAVHTTLAPLEVGTEVLVTCDWQRQVARRRPVLTSIALPSELSTVHTRLCFSLLPAVLPARCTVC